MHHFTKGLIWTLNEAVYNFNGFMLSYAAIVTPAVLGVTAALSWLFRSRRLMFTVTAALLTVWGCYALSQATDLHWRLYCIGMGERYVAPHPVPVAPAERTETGYIV